MDLSRDERNKLARGLPCEKGRECSWPLLKGVYHKFSSLLGVGDIQGILVSSFPEAALFIFISTKNRDLWEGPIFEHAHSNRFIFSANQFVRRDSEHAQSDGKSVNRGIPMLVLLLILGADQ